MQSKYKSYWRKSGLKGKWGNIFLERISLHNPKNVLEIGVFCGVTARNICDLLNKENGSNFNYIGVDLFGGGQSKGKDEIKPMFLKDQRFSNPLKNIYYNYILKENLNSIKSVSKLLRNYTNNIKLIAGDTNKVLKEVGREPLREKERNILIDAGFNLSEIDVINQEIESLNFEN